MMPRFRPFALAAARCPFWATSLLREIAQAQPAIDAHLPDDVLMVAVIPRAHVHPTAHVVVHDAALRTRARTLIATHAPLVTNAADPDAVLVVCSCQ